MKLFIYIKIETPTEDIYFSQVPIEDPSIDYKALIANVTPIKTEISDSKSFNSSTYQIEIIDEKQKIREILAPLNIYHQPLTLYVDNEITGDNIYQIKGIIKNHQPKSKGTYIIEATQTPPYLEKVYPEKSIAKACPQHEEIVEAARGIPMPEIYGLNHSWADQDPDPNQGIGEAQGFGAIRCHRIASGKYLVSSNHCALIFAWDAGVYCGENAVKSNEADNNCYINYTQPQELTNAGEKEPQYIQVNVHGYGTEFPGDWIYDPIHILSTFNDRHDIPYNSNSFSTVGAFTLQNQYFTAFPLQEYTRYYDILAAFALNFNFWWTINDNMEVYLKQEPDPESEPVYIFQHEISEFRAEGMSPIINRVHGSYHWVPADRFFYSEYNEVDPISIIMYNEKSVEIDFYHLVGTNAAAYKGRIQHVVHDYLTYRNTPREIASIKIPLLNFIGSGVGLGDVIGVIHPDTNTPGQNNYHIIGTTRDIWNQHVWLKIRNLYGIPRPDLFFSFSPETTANGIFTPEIGPTGTISGTPSYDPAPYGEYISLPQSGGNYIQLDEPLTGFPWTQSTGKGCTVAFWLGRGGIITLGCGDQWTDSQRRLRCDYNTTWSGTDAVRCVAGRGNVGAKLNVPGITAENVHVIIEINPESPIYSTFNMYINAEYKGTTEAMSHLISGMEIQFIGAWLQVSVYEGLLNKVANLYILKRHLKQGEKYNLAKR